MGKMKRLNHRQLLVFDEVLVVIAIAWLLFMLAELIKPGLVSNHYDLNLHFIIVIILMVVRIFQSND